MSLCRIAAIGACMVTSAMCPAIMWGWSLRRSGIAACVAVVLGQGNIPRMVLPVVVVGNIGGGVTVGILMVG